MAWRLGIGFPVCSHRRFCPLHLLEIFSKILTRPLPPDPEVLYEWFHEALKKGEIKGGCFRRGWGQAAAPGGGGGACPGGLVHRQPALGDGWPPGYPSGGGCLCANHRGREESSQIT